MSWNSSSRIAHVWSFLILSLLAENNVKWHEIARKYHLELQRDPGTQDALINFKQKAILITNLTYQQWWRGHDKGVVSSGIADTSDTAARHRETGSPWCSPYPRRWISWNSSNVLLVQWSSWTSFCHRGSYPHPAHAPWKSVPLLEITFAKRRGIRRDGLICWRD